MRVALLGDKIDQERLRNAHSLLSELNSHADDLKFSLQDEAQDESDVVVLLYDDGLSHRYSCKTRAIVWLNGEPPEIRKNPRTGWLNQFDLCIGLEQDRYSSSHWERKIILPYHIDLAAPERRKFLISCFHEQKNFESFREARQDTVSLICSSKRFTAAHLYRQTVAESCSENPMAIVGGDFVGQFIPDKFDFLKESRYEIVIENSEHREYLSEKLLDSLISGCTPIYYGAELPPELECGVIRLPKELWWKSEPREIMKALASEEPSGANSHTAFRNALFNYNPVLRLLAAFEVLDLGRPCVSRRIKPEKTRARSIISKQIWKMRKKLDFDAKRKLH